MRIFAPLWILLFALTTQAEVPPEAISQARKSILKKDRSAALKILADARATVGGTNIDREAERMGSIFFTERSQRDYELGESLLYSGSDKAKAKYLEAKEGEGQNFLINSGLIRVDLATKDCSSAASVLAAANEEWPYWVEYRWLALLIKECSEEEVELTELESFLETKNLHGFVQARKLARLVDSGRTSEAQALAKLLEKEDESYPELYYHLWRSQQQDSRGGEAAGEKYLSLCRAFGAKERRKYRLDPRLCVNVAEVTSANLKKENQE
jgi:hypothetical protein